MKLELSKINTVHSDQPVTLSTLLSLNEIEQ
jgi:hypothetical protein